MGYSGAAVPDEVQRAWVATRDARDAVVTELAGAWKPGAAITGASLDRVARGVLESRGFGSAFVHRTGHSIDLELHGSGPHLDSYETNDVRELAPGCGFSVEPGVYLSGRFYVARSTSCCIRIHLK
jgi:Xaa-Pro aminopeptidase